MNLIEIIKRAALDAVTASKPTDVVEGVITSVSPLRIQVSQMQILDNTFLIVMDSVKSLKYGERVAMIRTQGGQRFYVIGRLP